MDRRRFLSGAAAVAAYSRVGDISASPLGNPHASLVPMHVPGGPNYWCTWSVQNYMYGQHQPQLDPITLEGDSGNHLAHDQLNERVLLGRDGWAVQFYPQARSDLYLMLDDGWEIGGSATFELDPVKFPSFTGSPTERLLTLNRAVLAAGWRGLAVWCHDPAPDKSVQMEEQSQHAGIQYWKIDVGDPEFALIAIRNEHGIPLLLEHASGGGPLNGDWRKDGRFGPQPWGSTRQNFLAHTDVFRTYDVTSVLSLPTTLDRASEMLQGASGHEEAKALLNLEDEVYLAAALGCTMGVMRHPLIGLREHGDVDLFFNGPRRAKLRMDEVTRAVRWQRLAPPFASGCGTFVVSDEVLTDSWLFERGQNWEHELAGQIVNQGAPATVARNLPLPGVNAPAEKPFVFATKFPNGAIAVGVQERTNPQRGWHMPTAHVTVDVGSAPGPFAVFGCCESVTFVFSSEVKGRRLLVQDLAADAPRQIKPSHSAGKLTLTLTSADLMRYGLQAQTSGDLSSPGLVFAFRQD